MAVLRGHRGLWRVVSAVIILVFLAGCYVAISNLMRIDSSREEEVAKNIVKKVQKARHRGDNVEEADLMIAVHDNDYNAREHAVELHKNLENVDRVDSQVKIQLEGIVSRNRSIGANVDTKTSSTKERMSLTKWATSKTSVENNSVRMMILNGHLQMTISTRSTTRGMGILNLMDSTSTGTMSYCPTGTRWKRRSGRPVTGNPPMRLGPTSTPSWVATVRAIQLSSRIT